MQSETENTPSHRRETQYFANFRSHAEGLKRPLALAGVSTLGGFLLTAPMAFEHAMEDAQVVDAIADVPCTFEFNHKNKNQQKQNKTNRIYDKTAEQHGIGLSVEAKD